MVVVPVGEAEGGGWENRVVGWRWRVYLKRCQRDQRQQYLGLFLAGLSLLLVSLSDLLFD